LREFVAKEVKRRKNMGGQMFIDAVEARRGIQVPVGKVVHTAEFAFRVAGVDGDCYEAQKRATGLAEQALEDFLDTIENGEIIEPEDTIKSRRQVTAACREPELHMIELIFDATNNKQRSDRIMRATTEEMSFEPNPDGDDWICTDHNQRHFHVNVDKAASVGGCDCEDFVNRGSKQEMPCKHIYALLTSADRFWNDTGRKENR
jgi:hypothetical protein